MATIAQNESDSSYKSDQSGTDTERVLFRCSLNLKRRLRIRAAEQDKTVQAVCVEAIETYLSISGEGAAA